MSLLRTHLRYGAALACRTRVLPSQCRLVPDVASGGAWTRCIHSSEHARMVGSAPQPSELAAHIFMDLNWMDKLITDLATKKHGAEFGQQCAVDAAALLPHVLKRAGDVLSDVRLKRSLTLLGSFAYGSVAVRESRRQYDIMRVFLEEGWVIRNFDVAPPNGVPVCAPSIALAVDMVHACALSGSVDTGAVLHASTRAASAAAEKDASAAIPLQPTQAIVALLGSPMYTPALTRASQHGRAVVIGTAGRDMARIAGSLAPEQREISPVLVLDSIISDMIIPLATWRSQAMPMNQLLHQLHAAMLSKQGDAPVTATDMVTVMNEAGLLKQLRRHNVALKTLVRGASAHFAVTDGAAGSWTARALSTPAATILPAATADISTVETASTAAPTAAAATDAAPKAVAKAPTPPVDARPRPAQKSKSPQPQVKAPQLQLKEPASTTPRATDVAVSVPVPSTPALSSPPAPIIVEATTPPTPAAAAASVDATVPATPAAVTPAFVQSDVADTDPRLVALLNAATSARIIKDSKPKKDNYSAVWAALQRPQPKGAWKMTTVEWKRVLMAHEAELSAAITSRAAGPSSASPPASA